LLRQPPGESIWAPLVENDVSRQGVIEFWEKQDFNLKLPHDGNFSNCVYCPLKGRAKLTRIAAAELATEEQDGLTPASIDWWVKMEDKYGRNLKKEKREIKSEKKVKFIGFFGAANELAYQKIKEQAKAGPDSRKNINGEFLEEESYIPCNCTD